MPAPDQSVCTAHCNQGDAAAESGRIPPVPPMLAAPVIPYTAVMVHQVGGGISVRIDSSPPPSWHRPTAHPAALLLI